MGKDLAADGAERRLTEEEGADGLVIMHPPAAALGVEKASDR